MSKGCPTSCDSLSTLAIVGWGKGMLTTQFGNAREDACHEALVVLRFRDLDWFSFLRILH